MMFATKISGQVFGGALLVTLLGCSDGGSSIVDDTDVPDDNAACPLDACANGAPSHTPVAAGTACSQGNGTKCDGAGACVECLGPADCASGVCAMGACVAMPCVDG